MWPMPLLTPVSVCLERQDVQPLQLRYPVASLLIIVDYDDDIKSIFEHE